MGIMMESRATELTLCSQTPVHPTNPSPSTRGLFLGETEERRQTQEVDKVEVRGEGTGPPEHQPHAHLSGQVAAGFFSGENEQSQRKHIRTSTLCVRPAQDLLSPRKAQQPTDF